MADLAISFQGTPIRRTDERVNLTDMWRAAGSDKAKSPYEWLRQDGTVQFLEYLGETLNTGQGRVEKNAAPNGVSYDLVHVDRGGREPGTWAHWQVGMAYAKYLSPEFHAWCNEVVRAHMEQVQPMMLPSAQIQHLLVTMGRIAENHDLGLRTVAGAVHEVRAEVSTLGQRVSAVERHIIARRVDISTATKRTHRQTIVEHGGMCPCCGKVRILETVNGNALAQCEYDHFYASNRAKLHETWLICKACHDHISRNPRGHEEVDLQFKTHQLRVSQTKGPQLDLIPGGHHGR